MNLRVGKQICHETGIAKITVVKWTCKSKKQICYEVGIAKITVVRWSCVLENQIFYEVKIAKITVVSWTCKPKKLPVSGYQGIEVES